MEVDWFRWKKQTMWADGVDWVVRGVAGPGNGPGRAMRVWNNNNIFTLRELRKRALDDDDTAATG